MLPELRKASPIPRPESSIRRYRSIHGPAESRARRSSAARPCVAIHLIRNLGNGTTSERILRDMQVSAQGKERMSAVSASLADGIRCSVSRKRSACGFPHRQGDRLVWRLRKVAIDRPDTSKGKPMAAIDDAMRRWRAGSRFDGQSDYEICADALILAEAYMRDRDAELEYLRTARNPALVSEIADKKKPVSA